MCAFAISLVLGTIMNARPLLLALQTARPQTPRVQAAQHHLPSPSAPPQDNLIQLSPNLCREPAVSEVPPELHPRPDEQTHERPVPFFFDDGWWGDGERTERASKQDHIRLVEKDTRNVIVQGAHRLLGQEIGQKRGRNRSRARRHARDAPHIDPPGAHIDQLTRAALPTVQRLAKTPAQTRLAEKMQLWTVRDVFPRNVPETAFALERPCAVVFLVEFSSELGVVVMQGSNLLVQLRTASGGWRKSVCLTRLSQSPRQQRQDRKSP
jgi:hypothetical protein